ncbi:acyltransferase family protein [Pedomonas mirosovicensis]|uniref:acyltransferase family protein n=1 Tax=Pedomonas mirosovicensis TaxID=2908641 RepID=UPI002166EB0D|nr:acyltransferase [Pedomonas mirosovicensis]MCH8683979.1 acyltransferase [Pedomonas mirosovicensis]
MASGAVANDRFLTKPVSVYLDLVRFLAALSVLIGHGVQDGLYDGAYILTTLSHEAVMIFFVLSGLVIAETSLRKGRDAQAFIIARAARIYSVVIPAILLSFALYALAGGLGINAPGWAADPNFSWLTALGSLFFLNESWGSEMILPWNSPYWSISYEVFYYVMFGCLAFGRGQWRWLSFLLVALLAGPRVLALAPVWAMGVWIALDPRLRLRSPLLGLALVAATWAVVFWLDASQLDETVQNWLYSVVPGWWRLYMSQKLVTDYLLGFLVMANFIGFHACAPWFAPHMARIEGPVRFLAGSTFSLYLFHRPLTKLLEALGVSAGDDALAFTGLLLGVVAACFLLAEVTEKRRNAARRGIAALFERLSHARGEAVQDIRLKG